MASITKKVGDNLRLDMYMTNLGRLAGEDTIASVESVVSVPPGPTITDIGFGPTFVQFKAGGGTAGESYVISATVVTTDGDTLVGSGTLIVEA